LRHEKDLSPNAGGAALLAVSLTGGTWIYTQHPKFGKLPDGARLDTVKRSPNYSGDGSQNLIPTPVLVDDRSFVSVGIGYLFAKRIVRYRFAL
jgi:hypothetical protein